MTKTKPHLTIDLDDVRKHGGVEEAIVAWCKKSDTTTTGEVGPAFATSGPGPGWTQTFDVDDFARRALEGGALYYLDDDNGRLISATPLDDDDEEEDDDIIDPDGNRLCLGDWTEESVVELTCPSPEEALEHPVETATMAEAVMDLHYDASDVKAWRDLITSVRILADHLADL